jgi:polar amino acid transport system substrate-binding protein
MSTGFKNFQHACIVAACSLFAVAMLSSGASARTLAEVKYKGAISLCANPDALPFASEKADPPGFQIEIARAIAAGLGVSLELQWILPRYRANLVNCDILMDSIDDPAIYEGKLLLSRPYQRTGVALGVGPKATAVAGFGDVSKGQKVGVMVNSVAQVVLGKKGLSQSPYAFEQDMLDDLATGELYGAAASPATIAYYIRQHPQAGMRLVHAYDGEPQLAWKVSVGVRKSDQALVDAINQVLERMLADGTITAIYARYGVEHRAP